MNTVLSPLQRSLAQALNLQDEVEELYANCVYEFASEIGPEWLAGHAKRVKERTIIALEEEAVRLDALLDAGEHVDPDTTIVPQWKTMVNQMQLIARLASKPITRLAPTPDPKLILMNILVQAASVGDVFMVEHLLKDPRVNPNAWASAAITKACEIDAIDVVQLLLQDGRANPWALLQIASTRGTRGSKDMLKMILNRHDPRINPAEHDNDVIKQAAAHGFTDVVRLLLQDHRVNPAKALDYAVKNKHLDTVLLLIQDERVPYPVGPHDALLQLANEKQNEDAERLIHEVKSKRRMGRMSGGRKTRHRHRRRGSSQKTKRR